MHPLIVTFVSFAYWQITVYDYRIELSAYKAGYVAIIIYK